MRRNLHQSRSYNNPPWEDGAQVSVHASATVDQHYYGEISNTVNYEVATDEEFVNSEYNFTKKLEERYICMICSDLQQEPVVVSCCGKHFCKNCLEKWSKSQNTRRGYRSAHGNGSHLTAQQCPHCRETNISYFVNKQQVRDINELKVYCSNKSKGCEWQGSVGTLARHVGADSKRSEGFETASVCSRVEAQVPYSLEPSSAVSRPAQAPVPFPRSFTAPVETANQCEFEEIRCYKNCKKKVMRRELQDHLKTKCLCRNFACEHCGEEGTYHTITAECGEFGPCEVHTESHYDNCSEFPVECPNKCSATIKRKQLAAHRETCPLEPVKCSFSEVGCDVPLVRKSLENHLATSDHSHLMLMMKAYKELSERMSALETGKRSMNQELELDTAPCYRYTMTADWGEKIRNCCFEA